MADSAVLEGFLCPICMQDLGSVNELRDHFDVAHPEEDKALINQLKGLFGKAKKRLLRQELGDELGPQLGTSLAKTEPATSPYASEAYNTFAWETQELGVTRDLTDLFKSVRNSRIDRFVVETNKLLVRLDKLISADAPTDPNKRKAYEKGVVMWAPDSDARICMTCGKGFGLLRRRHHCRLCGRVQCHQCSHFLPINFARKLTNPAFSYEGEGFRRCGSSSSLNSVGSSNLGGEGETQIRVCRECRFLLERRHEQTAWKSSTPPIVFLYERIRENMNNASDLLPRYMSMSRSLSEGDTTFSLVEAVQCRAQLTKIYETIAMLNKRLMTLDGAEPKPLRLQQMVSASASAYVQENLLTLPPVSTQEQFDQLRARKKESALKRIENERRAAAERRARAEPAGQDQEPSRLSQEATGKGRAGGRKVATPGEGWKPSAQSRGKDVHDDPMIEQMNIIRGFIGEARSAGKWDELVMLEDNLRELQEEYWKQQKDRYEQEQRRAGVGERDGQDSPQREPEDDEETRSDDNTRSRSKPADDARSRSDVSTIQLTAASVNRSRIGEV